MRRIFLSALIGVGMVAAIFSTLSGSEAALTQQSYPLVCRGSANLEIGVAPGDGNIGFVFTRGTKPAVEGLSPGECSWVDRGMHDDEPDRLSQHVSPKAGPNLPSEGPRLLPIHTKPWSELHSPDKYWTFMVSNNGRGQLIATSFGGGYSVSTVYTVGFRLCSKAGGTSSNSSGTNDCPFRKGCFEECARRRISSSGSGNTSRSDN